MNESSLFFVQSEIENDDNRDLINSLRAYSGKLRQQIYVVRTPLTEEKYSYDYSSALVVLMPKRKLLFIDLGSNKDAFDEYANDFQEDLASLSDKYRYKEIIGRPKHWRELVAVESNPTPEDLGGLLDSLAVADAKQQRVCELLISLVTGSINDVSRIGSDEPESMLDRVKRKIILFDGEQTRFIYQKIGQKRIIIQGLSGTGKTELLLHKLREVYVTTESSRILFTCHNRILASTMRRRIPEFFNFMKVEKQIDWDVRLWCVHAWGSESVANSGAYRYICAQYSLVFHRYSANMSFDRACQMAIEELKESPDLGKKFVFDYVLLDESQDFPDSFVQLCEMVTEERVYVAGDIFQSIFEIERIDKVAPNFLLNRCYRTDPRTLMFSHALGLGLFEKEKLLWLTDQEWQYCGYNLVKLEGGRKYQFTREPLRRFEDLEAEGVHSVQLVECSSENSFPETAVQCVMDNISRIKNEHPTVTPDDIGVIFIDYSNEAYSMSDMLLVRVVEELGWDVNQAYTSKDKAPGKLFVSNINNVKGLEFPFVICIVRRIRAWKRQRNSLYMALTRSFIKSFLIVQEDSSTDLLSRLEVGLAEILEASAMTIEVPASPPTFSTISPAEKTLSLTETIQNIFDEYEVEKHLQGRLRKLAAASFSDDYKHDDVAEFIQVNRRLLVNRKA